MAAPKSVAVIMAGGSGTRFWPASRAEKPKQYLGLSGEASLIQLTVERLEPNFSDSHIYVCSTASQRSQLESQLPQISHLILEPEAKNTAACVALSALTLLKEGHSPDTVMVTLPADHYISVPDKFRSILSKACVFARETRSLVTIGIVPTFAHTGYGYIARGEESKVAKEFFSVERFVEKPDRQKAEEYVKSGRFYWNSGMFVWTLSAIELAFQTYLPEMWRLLSAAIGTNANVLAAAYAKLPSLPIDIGIMEKAKNVAVIPAEFGWNDVGSWSAVYSLKDSDQSGNVTLGGKSLAVESKGCLVFTPEGTEVALVGVENLIVVQDGNRILVCNKDKDQSVRDAAKHFK